MKFFLNDYKKLRAIIEPSDPLAKMARVGDECSPEAPRHYPHELNLAAINAACISGEATVAVHESGYGYQIVLPDNFEFPVIRQSRQVRVGWEPDSEHAIEKEGAKYAPNGGSAIYWEQRLVVNGQPQEWAGRYTEPLGEVVE